MTMKLCLGTVQFGMNYGVQGNGQPHREKVYDMLSYASSHGISVFDTASAYGEAEDVLGDYIRSYPDVSQNMRLVSKLRPDAFREQPVSNWSHVVENNAIESLKRLGIGKFEAYLFHNAAYIFNPNAVESMSVIIEKGYADKIGVSIYTPEEAMKALEYTQIGAIQVPYNVFDRRLDKCGFFEKALAQGVNVYARSSLLQGLVMMNPDNLPERVEFAKNYLTEYMRICKQFDISPLSAAIGYVTSKKGIDYVVFGVDNMQQLSEYIEIERQNIPQGLVETFDLAFDDVEEKLVNPALWNK